MFSRLCALKSPKLVLFAMILGLQACTTLPGFSEANYVDPFDGAEVSENRTRYSQALACIRPALQRAGKDRFAVGKVLDFTGKEDLVNGKRLTQGAALMVMSALSEAGVPLVERFDTSIADIELKYSDNKLISDSETGEQPYRKIFSGSLPGSEYHVVGGITEVNYNIRSGAVESSIRFLSNGARYFVMNIAVDLRLVKTKTLEVVNVQSVQKQIIGTELRGGFFRIFNDGLVDIAASERTQEPIQRGVRMVLEQAVFNMLNEVYALRAENCLNPTRQDQTPFKQASVRSNNTRNATGAQGAGLAKPAADAANNAAPTAATAPAYSSTTAARVSPIADQPTATPVQRSGGSNRLQQQEVVIDPNTGEAVYATPSAQQSPVEAAQFGSRSTHSDSNFGQNTSTAGPGEPEQATVSGLNSGVGLSSEPSPTTDRMPEKLLWGSRPVIQ